jgi:hypothetical protein
MVLLIGSLLGSAMVPANCPAREHAPGDPSLRARPGKLAESVARRDRGAYEFPTPREQFVAWALNAAGPSALGGSATSASWGQWVSEEPPEWDGGGRGFSKRLGTGVVTTVITETSQSMLSAAMTQDPAYYRCPRPGFGPRLGHALRMAVYARDHDGNAVFSPAKTLAPFVGPIATRTTLYPARYTWRDGAVSGACGLLINAGWNIAKEFVMSAPTWWLAPEGPAEEAPPPRAGALRPAT